MSTNNTASSICLLGGDTRQIYAALELSTMMDCRIVVSGETLSTHFGYGGNDKIIYEVAYKQGGKHYKDSVSFSNMRRKDESGEVKRVCPNCQAIITESSDKAGECEYCGYQLSAATEWLCVDMKKDM